MPKLTETTNDKLRANGGHLPVEMRIVEAHEPLPGEPWPAPVITPMTEKPKRGRKLKEQIANPPVAPAPAIQPLKIALIGTAPSSRMLAPFNDPTWKIWGCSPGNMGTVLPRIDVWFEIHGVALLEPEDAHYAPNYINWMKSLTIPILMQDQAIVPNAISIPKDLLIAKFGPYFFTSSFAWMMAMAICEIEQLPPDVRAQSEIKLFGIDMASREEYIIQRPGAYHFFQEAARRGIKITAPHESDIMQAPPLYGYSDVGPMGTKLRHRKKELNGRLGPMRAQRDELHRQITYLEGALEDLDYIACIQGGAQDNSNGQSYLESLRSLALTPVKVSVTSNSQG